LKLVVCCSALFLLWMRIYFILCVVLSWFLLLWAEITHCEGAPEKENHVSKKLVRFS
jgi:hypothetical protein